MPTRLSDHFGPEDKPIRAPYNQKTENANGEFRRNSARRQTWRTCCTYFLHGVFRSFYETITYVLLPLCWNNLFMYELAYLFISQLLNRLNLSIEAFLKQPNKLS